MRPWSRFAIRLAGALPLWLLLVVLLTPAHEYAHCMAGWAGGATDDCTVTYEYQPSISGRLAHASIFGPNDHIWLYPAEFALIFAVGLIFMLWVIAPLIEKVRLPALPQRRLAGKSRAGVPVPEVQGVAHGVAIRREHAVTPPRTGLAPHERRLTASIVQDRETHRSPGDRRRLGRVAGPGET